MSLGEDRLGEKGDALYAALLKAHEGLTGADSHALNARLVLLLANELGDPERAAEIFAAAREMGRETGRES